MPRPNIGPHLAPGKNGVWDISFTGGGRSRRRSTGTADRQQAQKVLAAFLTLDTRDVPLSATAVTLVGDTLTAYSIEHVTEKVANKEIAELNIRYLRAHFGPLEVRQVAPSDVDAFVRRRRGGWPAGNRVGDATIRRELSTLSAAIHHAVRAKRVPGAEAPHIALPPKPDPRDRWLTHDEADKLLEAALRGCGADDRLPRAYRFIAIVLATGSRKTAVLELTRGQVDMTQGMIRLNPRGRVQTKKRRPMVPISDELMPIMARILREVGDKEGDYILDHAGAIRTSFDSACGRAGLVGVTPHTLRHTWATWAAQAGVSLVDIAGVLGDTIQTVTNNYLHHSPGHLRSAVNAVRRRA